MASSIAHLYRGRDGQARYEKWRTEIFERLESEYGATDDNLDMIFEADLRMMYDDGYTVDSAMSVTADELGLAEVA